MLLLNSREGISVEKLLSSISEQLLGGNNMTIKICRTKHKSNPKQYNQNPLTPSHEQNENPHLNH